jgi:hypothetical protein
MKSSLDRHSVEIQWRNLNSPQNYRELNAGGAQNYIASLFQRLFRKGISP